MNKIVSLIASNNLNKLEDYKIDLIESNDINSIKDLVYAYSSHHPNSDMNEIVNYALVKNNKELAFYILGHMMRELDDETVKRLFTLVLTEEDNLVEYDYESKFYSLFKVNILNPIGYGYRFEDKQDNPLFLTLEKRSVELMNLLVEVIALTDNKLAAEILLDEYKDEQLHEKIRHMEKERKLLLELRK